MKEDLLIIEELDSIRGGEKALMCINGKWVWVETQGEDN
jgi:hypothetical protein